MSVRLTVDVAAWQRHVDTVRSAVEGLVPVVKGNGYGFGRPWLYAHWDWLDTVAVGTVYEMGDMPAHLDAVVLTPTLNIPSIDHERLTLTVGRPEHLSAAAAAVADGAIAPPAIVIKVRTSMARYGCAADEAGRLVHSVDAMGWELRGVALHPPLARDAAENDANADELATLAERLDPAWPLWVSHVDPETYGRLRERHPRRSWRLRAGTALWHGDKSMLHLDVDVVDRCPVTAGQRVGYRRTPVTADGWLVVAGGGSAHGIAALTDGRSPFHYRRRRIEMIEPPHMHSTLLFVDAASDVPELGARLDLQRPLISTAVDEVIER